MGGDDTGSLSPTFSVNGSISLKNEKQSPFSVYELSRDSHLHFQTLSKHTSRKQTLNETSSLADNYESTQIRRKSKHLLLWLKEQVKKRRHLFRCLFNGVLGNCNASCKSRDTQFALGFLHNEKTIYVSTKLIKLKLLT